MTKQKKTIAKPARAGTKARKQPAEAAAAPKTKLGQLEGMLRRPRARPSPSSPRRWAGRPTACAARCRAP